jgi:hypothetical protein
MGLLHDIVAIVHVADGGRRAELRIEALEDCGIGLAAICHDVLGDTLTANGF